MDPARHLYIHIPFCSGKCAYCAFYSVVYSEAAASRYLDALERELIGSIQAGCVAECETVYIGGGSPSMLSGDDWGRLMALLRLVGQGSVTEWTVEVNPGDVSHAALVRMAAAGVNRISMGAQSFDDTVLAAMNRRHAVADILFAFAAAREVGITNVGLDLIAGLPGVDADVWGETLRQAVALAPEHLSVYALGLEPGTALWQRVHRGEVDGPDDERVLIALQQAERCLSRAGYPQYEISNYAQPGYACQHNLSCWRGEDYLGLGPAAASRVGMKRWTNTAELEGYCEAIEHGAPPAREDEECLEPRADLCERLLFGFRLREGVAVESRCMNAGEAGASLWRAWEPLLDQWSKEGLLVQEGERWIATERGREVLDSVLESLVE